MESKGDEMSFDKSERHNSRKQLKLLMLSNMKMRKQMKASIRGRFINRLRLEEEVLTLNKLAQSLITHLLGTQQADTSTFYNPVQLTDIFENSTNTTSQALQKKSDEYTLYCDKCSFKSKKKTPFDVHMRRHENLRQYSCEECSQSFVTLAELKIHQQKHGKGKLYSCDQCSYSTYNAYVLVSHKERIHLMCRTYSCNLCDFTTQDKSSWQDHKMSNPSHKAENHCVACKSMRKRLKITDSQSSDVDVFGKNGDENSIRHTCGNKWKCETCGLLYKRRDSLKKHSVKHAAEREYKCDICEYSATTKHSLTVHIRSHSGEKPYQCSECPFACSTKSYLTVHINNHLGIKPYGCDLCSFRSADSSKISKHKQRMHKESESSNVINTSSGGMQIQPVLQTSSISSGGTSKMMCKHCGRMFHTMGALIHHEKEHSGG